MPCLHLFLSNLVGPEFLLYLPSVWFVVGLPSLTAPLLCRRTGCGVPARDQDRRFFLRMLALPERDEGPLFTENSFEYLISQAIQIVEVNVLFAPIIHSDVVTEVTPQIRCLMDKPLPCVINMSPK